MGNLTHGNARAARRREASRTLPCRQPGDGHGGARWPRTSLRFGRGDGDRGHEHQDKSRCRRRGDVPERGIPIGADAGADLTYSGPVEVHEHRSNHSEHAGTTDWLKRERSG